ncbi:potassium voltage-gated channel [Lynx pardinus]|uniref:Potassium voltage-gated channel n=1 Tax=Lynx pardinus TaxID=191816 RepID=A0A485N9P4_LYNPA|nr:potassium voltage-gated channel [Lynx pardinus]
MQAQALRPERGRAPGAMALRPEPAGGRRVVTINVGGCRVRLAWAALARCPLARLERLRLVRTLDDIGPLIQDCARGTKARQVPVASVVCTCRAEALPSPSPPLLWGPHTHVGAPVSTRLNYCVGPPSGVSKVTEAQLTPVAGRGQGRAECGLWPDLAGRPRFWRLRARSGGLRTVWRTGHRKFNSGKWLPDSFCAAAAGVLLGDGAEHPPRGWPWARATHSRLSENRVSSGKALGEAGECSPKCRSLFVLETVCVAWFSFEFLLRSLRAESKCAFLRTPLNIIDILAILPFYVSLLAGLAAGGAGAGAGGAALLERAGLALRLLRALRVLYVMRLARHSLGLRSLGLTVRRCAREFGLLLLFLCVALALFAPLVHLAERELGARRDFSSVPASYWWAVISMTTVGYGDMVPRSLPGQVVALSSILSGILLMAFPATSIFHTFSRSYSELKEQQRRAVGPERAPRDDSTRSDSTRSAPATEDGAQGPGGGHGCRPGPGPAPEEPLQK